MKTQGFAILIILSLLLSACGDIDESQESVISDDTWTIAYDYLGVNHLSNNKDDFPANLLSGRIDADVRFRINRGEWQQVFKRTTALYRPPEHEASFARSIERFDKGLKVTDYKPGMPFSVDQVYTIEGEVLEWDIILENRMYYDIDIGDVAISIPWSRASGPTQEDLFEGGFLKHENISGDGSYVLFVKRSGNPPYLLLTVKPGTRLEYSTSQQGTLRAFVHSGYSGNQQEQGSWRQEHTYSGLGPRGSESERLEFGFRLQWAQSYDDLRDILYENRLIDFRVVPGMTIPKGLDARFSLRTKCDIDSVIAEFPEQTRIEYMGEKLPDHHIYNVYFEKPGENMLTVHFDGGRETYLEFFLTEPIKTLIEKRNDFIVRNQQHRNPELWYDGLFSIWDMKNSVLRGPDNTDGYDGWWGYMVACDDPVLGIAPYLASVNAHFPVQEQIEAIEYHIENYVWGGLQRTDQEEPYAYGIYGVPNFKVAKDTMKRAQIESRRLDKMKIWRTYDYPHLFMLYYHMYQIADRYPQMVSYLDAGGYLERMWHTARAFFEYPYQIYPWYDIYKWGNYNEMLIPEMIELLEREGWMEEAAWLRDEWEKKAKYFIYDDPFPYRSEYATDRTAFESSYALARYGATNEMEDRDSLWYDINEDKWYSHSNVEKADALDFMERQHLAGLAVRGWLQPKYYLLGSDHSLSYMARMGGWSVLDYGIRFADDPHDWLQLGYASYLSSFALINSGPPETDFGFWYPGPENDGALGWAFMTEKHGRAWILKNEDRGPWRYDGEQNLGMGAVTRMASVILADDPLFGRIAYGAKLDDVGTDYHIWPADGVGIRFWIMEDDFRLGIEMERDGFSDDQPIVVSKDVNNIEFILENRAGAPHNTTIYLDGTGYEDWELFIDGDAMLPDSENGRQAYKVEVDNLEHTVLLRRR